MTLDESLLSNFLLFNLSKKINRWYSCFGLRPDPNR